jgi:hypothetical protein
MKKYSVLLLVDVSETISASFTISDVPANTPVTAVHVAVKQILSLPSLNEANITIAEIVQQRPAKKELH